MFDFLAEKLQSALKSLTSKGILTEADIDATLRELRIGLLEADVALPAIKHLLTRVKEEALGQSVLTGINPGQQVVKIVYDQLVELLGQPAQVAFPATPPAVILLCGLQGSGKTTTAGKLANWLKKQNKTVTLASLDVYRPAAIQQLATLAAQLQVPVLESASQKPLERTKQAMDMAKKNVSDVLILDTAGRMEIATDLLEELKEIHSLSHPAAALLVADAQTGQVAVQVAESFNKTVPLTGLVLTRMDGDARGGAALSLRHVTGVPIQFLGTGEKLDNFELFRPEGLAGRILGQGDVVALVEKVQQAASEEDNSALENKILSGQKMDFADLAKQLRMMQRMGGLSGIMGFMPGLGALKSKLDSAKLDDSVIRRQLAVIGSMTRQERKNPLLLNAKRRLRIAKGAGVTVNDVNKLVKMHEAMNQMSKMLKSGQLQKLMKR